MAFPSRNMLSLRGAFNISSRGVAPAESSPDIRYTVHSKNIRRVAGDRTPSRVGSLRDARNLDTGDVFVGGVFDVELELEGFFIARV